MAKSQPVRTSKSSKTAAPKILGVSRDGVRILKPVGPATHFSDREIRQAIREVLAAQKAG